MLPRNFRFIIRLPLWWNVDLSDKEFPSTYPSDNFEIDMKIPEPCQKKLDSKFISNWTYKVRKYAELELAMMLERNRE